MPSSPRSSVQARQPVPTSSLETMTDLYELKSRHPGRQRKLHPADLYLDEPWRAGAVPSPAAQWKATPSRRQASARTPWASTARLAPRKFCPCSAALPQRACRGVPVFVKPNAGLPNPDGSYNLDPDGFAAEMKEYAAIGVSMVGGCCGTTPAFIAKLHETFSPLAPADKIPIRRSCLCTPVRFVEVNGITVVGERINPTGSVAAGL